MVNTTIKTTTVRRRPRGRGRTSLVRCPREPPPVPRDKSRRNVTAYADIVFSSVREEKNDRRYLTDDIPSGLLKIN